MKSILVVGAGKEGKGFIGETFSADGWKVSFLDKDPEVISNLKNGSYNVCLFEPEGPRIRTVTGYSAYLTDDKYSCMADALEADIYVLAVYPEDIPEVARYLAKAIEVRCELSKKLTIISCTNKNHYIEEVSTKFREALASEKAKSWFNNNVAVRDAIVRRSTNAASNSALDIDTTVCLTLLVQKPVYVELDGLRWVELKDGIERLKDIKLYTYNAPHAACAYYGYYKGYNTILQASADAEIDDLKRKILQEAIPALSREFEVPEKEIWEFCTFPKMKVDMDDDIFRVAYDPIRKLSRYDRLTGNAVFCMKYGYKPDALTTAIALGMAYDDERDKNAQTIQQYIKEMGIAKAVSAVCGLPQEHDIVNIVSKKYVELVPSK